MRDLLVHDVFKGDETRYLQWWSRRERQPVKAPSVPAPSDDDIGRALYRAGLISYPYATAEIKRFRREMGW